MSAFISNWELFQACLVETSPVQKCGGWETKGATWGTLSPQERQASRCITLEHFGHREAGENMFRERRDDVRNISADREGNIPASDKTSTELLNGCLEHER